MTADPALVIATARRWLGTPYHDQASLHGVGCDCLGLARGVWREVVGDESFPIPPYSRDWGEMGPREASEPVPQGANRSSGAIGGGEGPIGLAEGARRMMMEAAPADAPPGALVLFRMAPRAIAKHVGILTGPDRFIHAYERLGVIEQGLTPSWRRRIAFLFPRS
ncbi:NlpC/P60 family protein [Roseovarius autotrophicus]|uniref:NlpC/P60 family protein n=1 Tax=Roseovarius autotrophicus TaxID=2824121 RepID=UPI001B397A9A|nr:NlpC/P60 family protein [Roseovarius autotrophicus]